MRVHEFKVQDLEDIAAVVSSDPLQADIAAIQFHWLRVTGVDDVAGMGDADTAFASRLRQTYPHMPVMSNTI